MGEKATNELIYKTLTGLRDENRKFREEMNEFRRETGERFDAMREHIGAQQMDIAHIYRRIDYLTEELEKIKAQLPPRPH